MGKSARERLNETIQRDKRELGGVGHEIKKEKIEAVKEVEQKNNNNLRASEVKDNEKVDYQEEDNDDEYVESGFNWKKLFVILLILIISLSGILVLWSNGYDIVNFAFDKVNEKIESDKDIEEEIQNENASIVAVDLKTCYEKVHHMVNTIIIAEDGNIWGESEITLDAIKQVIYEINGQDEYIDNELSKWLELDFTNAVDVHNYVWNKLGGTVGKAKSLNEEKIQELVQILGE